MSTPAGTDGTEPRTREYDAPPPQEAPPGDPAEEYRPGWMDGANGGIGDGGGPDNGGDPEPEPADPEPNDGEEGGVDE